MGDQQYGQAEPLVQIAQQPEDGAGGLRVEGTGGLVRQEHLGVAGQGAGDADALLLAAGQLAGVGPRLVGETDQVEEFEGLAAPLAAREPEDLQRKFDVALDGAGRQQVEVLEDHADPAAGRAQFPTGARALPGEGGELDAVHGDGAGGGALQQVDAADQGGLAGAALPDDAVHLAFPDMEVDAVQGGDLASSRAVDLGQARCGDHWVRPSLSSARQGRRRARGFRRRYRRTGRKPPFPYGADTGSGRCRAQSSAATARGSRRRGPGRGRCGSGHGVRGAATVLLRGRRRPRGLSLRGARCGSGALRRRTFDTDNEHRAWCSPRSQGCGCSSWSWR
nr:putative hydrolase [Streptomyces tsukubensis NRRL18488]